MVPEPVTEPAGQVPTVIDRVGPGGGVASDSAFGVALVTLWQRCAEAGDPVGFDLPVVRGEVAARAAGLVEEIKTGRLVAVAANRTRRLLGVAFLRPGRGSGRHTGYLALLLVDPDHRRQGLGSELTRTILVSARESGLDRVDALVAAGSGGENLLRTLGFTDWGRRPGWIVGPDADPRDELVMGLVL